MCMVRIASRDRVPSNLTTWQPSGELQDSFCCLLRVYSIALSYVVFLVDVLSFLLISLFCYMINNDSSDRTMLNLQGTFSYYGQGKASILRSFGASLLCRRFVSAADFMCCGMKDVCVLYVLWCISLHHLLCNAKRRRSV